MAWTLVGIDAAAQDERLGLACGRLTDAGELQLDRVTLGTAGESAEATVAGWLHGQPRHLVAINAPLAFPAGLGTALVDHRAGQLLPAVDADDLLTRRTERVVQSLTGRAPRGVTSDGLMPRALSALALLARIRARAPHPLPLAWVQAQDSGVLEVRVQASLRALGLPHAPYAGRSHKARHTREAIVDALRGHMALHVRDEVLTEHVDLLDATLAVAAAADFARGLCVAPDDLTQAKREGWIWLRGDGQVRLF